MMSSPHGPYELGYTRDTMAMTKGYNDASRSETQKIVKFGLFSETREHEGGIASNRGSARHGEFVPEPWTPCPSHCGSVFDFKNIREIKKKPKKWKSTSFFFFFDLSPNISQ